MNSRETLSLPTIYVIVLLSISSITYSFAYVSYSYFVRYFALELGVDYSRQALYDSLGNILSAFGILLIGISSDRLGRILTASIASLTGVFSALAALSRDPLLGIPIAIVFLNISFATTIIARNLLMIELGGDAVGRLFGGVMTLGALAMIAGPVIGLWAKNLYGYEFLFTITAFLYLISSLSIYMLRFKVREIRYVNDNSIISMIRNLKVTNSVPQDLYARRLFIFAVIDKFSYSMWAQMIYALAASEKIPLDISAYLTTVMNLSWFVSQYVFGIATDKISSISILRFSELITGLSAFILALAISFNYYPLLYLSFILIGLSYSSWIPSYNKYVQLYIKPDQRAIYMSIINIYAILIASPAPYLGGILRGIISPGVFHLYLASLVHSLNSYLTLPREVKLSHFKNPLKMKRHKSLH